MDNNLGILSRRDVYLPQRGVGLDQLVRQHAVRMRMPIVKVDPVALGLQHRCIVLRQPGARFAGCALTQTSRSSWTPRSPHSYKSDHYPKIKAQIPASHL